MFPKSDNSHLVCECGRISKLPFSSAIKDYSFCSVSKIDINYEASKLVDRPMGTYTSIFLGGFGNLCSDAVSEIVEKTACELGLLCEKQIKDSKGKRILVVGLGNSQVTHDSLGARVCERLSPTENLYVFPVGVSGKSGIESASIVKGIAECAGAELVIAVDSLAARGEERVGRVIQLFDGGIAPGSGAGNSCAAIDKDAVGVPVVSIGVPTALAEAEIRERGYLLVGDNVLELCDEAARIIADAMEICFSNQT